MKELRCYPLRPNPVAIAPGVPERAWMEDYNNNHPYRCLPMTMANATGWELRTPSAFRATWNGGPSKADVTLESLSFANRTAHQDFAAVLFTRGILTFVTGYLFQTPPGWDLWVCGPPNVIKHGIQPLTGLVETDWLAQPFTMNWRFTAPGTVEFAAGEPFGFIMPVPHAAIDDFEPVIKDIAKEPELLAKTEGARQSRHQFRLALKRGDPEAQAQVWQKHYFRGEHFDGSVGSTDHLTKRRLRAPRDERERG